MSKFDLGQQVLVLGCASGQLKNFIGKIGEVKYVYTDDVSYNVVFPDHKYSVYAKDGELQTAEDKSKFHKHHDLIIAWAKGAKIQVRRDEGEPWQDCDQRPQWFEEFEYGIKPEPKPDVVRYSAVDSASCDFFHEKEQTNTDNVKFTFDGETGKLKAVELI